MHPGVPPRGTTRVNSEKNSGFSFRKTRKLIPKFLSLKTHRSKGTDNKEWYLDSVGRDQTAGKYINDSRGVQEINDKGKLVRARNNVYYSEKLQEHQGVRKWCVNVICFRHIPKGRELFARYGKFY